MVLRRELRDFQVFAGGELDTGSPAGCAVGTDYDGESGWQPPPEPENRRKNNPPQQFAEVVAGGTQHRVDFVAFSTGQIVAVHAVVAFQVSDRGLDRCATAEHAFQGPRRLLGDRPHHVDDRRACVAVASIALGAHDIVGRTARQALDLSDRTAERVSVVRIAVEGLGADNPVALARGCHARLAAKLVTLVYFALTDAFHLGSMHAVELVFAGASLSEQTLGQSDQLAERPIGDLALQFAGLALNVAHHAAQDRLELPSHLRRPLHLSG